MTKARELGDNAQNTKPKVIDAKGDLIVGTGADAADNLAAGASGETLVADSSATTGLRWQGNFAAGKNKIINGDFRFNQRSFTSNTATNSFNFDRFAQFNGGTSGTLTTTPQVFTPGTAPVSGYEGANYLQGVTAAGADTNTFAGFYQRIESVRTFANQIVTVSFYAKAASGTPGIGVEVTQNFGTGGSPSSEVNTAAGALTLSTSWARYSVSFTVPSISGKTLGTTNDGFLQVNFWLSGGSAVATRSSNIGIQNNTFQIWGVQAEAGNVATAFQTATGTLAGELAACQRYFYLLASGSGQLIGNGIYTSATQINAVIPLRVTMRTAPTLSVVTGTDFYATYNGASDLLDSLTIFAAKTTTAGLFNNSQAAGTQYRPAYLETNNAASFVAFSAEL